MSNAATQPTIHLVIYPRPFAADTGASSKTLDGYCGASADWVGVGRPMILRRYFSCSG
jgi:hypothetical protein